MIKLSELKRLDKVSLAEIEKIIETYDDLRMAITREIKRCGSIEEYEKILEEVFERWGHFSEDSEVEKKRRAKFFAILEQMKAESAGVKNV